jgi:predicted permease
MKRYDEEALDAEIRAHIAERIDDLRAGGLTDEEARRQALMEFGNIARLKEDARSVWISLWWDQLCEDVRHGFRFLGAKRMFCVVAIATVALSIGSSIAVFTTVDALFFQPLALENPGQLRLLRWSAPHLRIAGGVGALLEAQGATETGQFSYAAYNQLRQHARAFANVACDRFWSFDVEDARNVNGQFVSGTYFTTLGARSFAGRLLNQDDDRPEATPVAVLGYDFWKSEFHGDFGIVGRAIKINNQQTVTVVGITAPEFHGINPSWDAGIRLPFALHGSLGASRLDTDPWSACQRVIARLEAGVSDEQARQATEGQIRAVFQDGNATADLAAVRIEFIDLQYGTSEVRDSALRPVTILASATLMILLVACVAIGSLLLARGAGRQQEIATRLALGASRSRILRQLLTENGLIATVGGAVGIALAFAARRLLPSLIGQLSGFQNLKLPDYADSRVLMAGLVLTFTSAAIFGLLPAFFNCQVDLMTAMRRKTRARDSRWRFIVTSGKATIALQVGFSVLFLVGMGLFVRTVAQLRAGFGYNPANLIYFRVTSLPLNAPGDFVERTYEELRRIAGVNAVGASVWPLFAADEHREQALRVCVPGTAKDATASGAAAPGAGYVQVPPRGPDLVGQEMVSRGYFEAWGVPLISGTDFDWQQRRDNERVTIVNTTFSRQFFGEENPVGRTIGFGACPGLAVTIVGVVADSTNTARLKPAPMLYRPMNVLQVRTPTFAVRTAYEPDSVIPQIRRFLEAQGIRIDGRDVSLGIDYRDRMIVREAFIARLMIGLALATLFIACVGLYGLLTYVVERQTPEIGLRMAVGAQANDVVCMVLGQTITPVVTGLAGGLAAAYWLTRFIETLLFGVRRLDFVSFAMACGLLVICAVIAAFIPAARAARLDPMRALRCD